MTFSRSQSHLSYLLQGRNIADGLSQPLTVKIQIHVSLFIHDVSLQVWGLRHTQSGREVTVPRSLGCLVAEYTLNWHLCTPTANPPKEEKSHLVTSIPSPYLLHSTSSC